MLKLKTSIGGKIIIVSLNWFSNLVIILDSKYDVIKINAVDMDSIIFIITMNYKKEEKYIYWLNCFDLIFLNQVVTNKNL
jgi:hypothetical protein